MYALDRAISVAGGALGLSCAGVGVAVGGGADWVHPPITPRSRSAASKRETCFFIRFAILPLLLGAERSGYAPCKTVSGFPHAPVPRLFRPILPPCCGGFNAAKLFWFVLQLFLHISRGVPVNIGTPRHLLSSFFHRSYNWEQDGQPVNSAAGPQAQVASVLFRQQCESRVEQELGKSGGNAAKDMTKQARQGADQGGGLDVR